MGTSNLKPEQHDGIDTLETTESNLLYAKRNLKFPLSFLWSFLIVKVLETDLI